MSFYKWLSKENNYLLLKNAFFKNAYELKPNKKFGLVLTNLKNFKKWISSTNNPEQREKDLTYVLKNKKLWNGPWLDIFDNLDENDILKNVDFSILNTSDISIYELLSSSYNKVLINNNFKEEFIALVRKYADENKFNNNLKKEIGKNINLYFDELKNKYSIQVMDIISLVDEQSIVDFNKDTGEFAISLIKQNTDDFLHGTSNNPRPMRRKFWNETEKTKN